MTAPTTDRPRRQRPPVATVAAVCALLVGLVGVGVGIIGIATSGEAKETATAAEAKAEAAEAKAEAILEARDAARKIACDQFNAQQARARDGEKAQIRSVLDPTRERTPDEQAAIDALLSRHDAQVDESYPDRDCTPAGIAAFYQEQEAKQP